MNHNAPPNADHSIADLLRQLSSDTATLVRQELELAKLEIGRKGKSATVSAEMFGATAILGFGAFAALTTCIIAALALVLPLWAAALIVTVVYGVAAAIAAMRGKSALTEMVTPIPQESVTSVKRDIEAVGAAVRRGR